MVYLHNGVILSSILGIRSHGFAFSFHRKSFILMKVLSLTYVTMIFSFPSQYRTLFTLPITLPSNKGPHNIPSNSRISMHLSSFQWESLLLSKLALLFFGADTTTLIKLNHKSLWSSRFNHLCLSWWTAHEYGQVL